MSEPDLSAILCLHCQTPMIAGILKDPANVIHIESLCSLERSSLEAWICPECGYVELRVPHPKSLARHDISDEDLGIDRDNRKSWKDWEGKR
jgi:hypothetical protein